MQAKTYYCGRGTESVFHVLGFLRSCFVVTVCVRTLECKYIHKKASDGSEREVRGAGGCVCEKTTRRKWIESNRYVLCQDFSAAFRLKYRLIFSVLPTYAKWQLFRVIPPVRGAVASWLVRSSPERALQVRSLAGVIVLCS